MRKDKKCLGHRCVAWGKNASRPRKGAVTHFQGIRAAFWDFSKLENSSAPSHPGDRRPQNTARWPQFPAERAQLKLSQMCSNPKPAAGNMPSTGIPSSLHHFHSPQVPQASALVTEDFDKTPRYMLPLLTHLHSPNVTTSRDLHQPRGWGWGPEIIASLWRSKGPIQSCDM